MADHVRWGILGAANFAKTIMGPAINEARHGRLVAVASRDPKKAQPFADLAPGLTIHDSYEALLADPEVDAVYIPLPNSLHVHWSVAAAEAGKAVLCEKPIGMEEADFDRLIAARDATGHLIAEAYMVVHHPQWIKAKEIVQSGVLGNIHTVTCAFTYGLPQGDNVRNDASLGGGGLRDIGVYPIGTFRFCTGLEPEPDWAEMITEKGVDVFTWVQAHAGDTRFVFHLAMRATPRQEMVFEGDKGWLRVTVPFNAQVAGGPQLDLAIAGEEMRVFRFTNERQYVHQVEAFNDHLLNGTPYPCPLEFSRGTQAMIDKVFAVAKARERG
ncbi:Gfo/Idh/MocA family oxidoreductase [Rhodobacterales bacterium HKCCE2091]|nr:Gfo/Idh/MocA family oxidoreductase [Rhodobacterales bacterium HKCCE2091]